MRNRARVTLEGARAPQSQPGAVSEPNRHTAARRSVSGVETLLNLQRTHGNAVVQRLVQRKLAVSQPETQAKTVHAGDFTVERDIFSAQGEHRLGSAEGRRNPRTGRPGSFQVSDGNRRTGDPAAIGNRVTVRFRQLGSGRRGDPFAAVVNADAPMSSYLPGLDETEAEEKPLEHWVPGEMPVTEEPPVIEEPLVTGQPVSSEPGEEPGYASLPSLGAPAKNKPPELPIIAGLHHKVDVKRGAVPLSAEIFGLTMSEVATENMHIAPAPTIDAFIVNGDMVHKITWDVFEDIGPKDQVDITSVSDPDITSGNYREVAKDLKPGDGNVSPREGFFASDLTKRHEMFHIFRHVRYYREGLALGLKWLNGRTAKSVNEVVELVGKMREKIDDYGRTKTDPSLSGEEHDAYEAGAPLYLARSEDILKKGRAGDYP